MKTTLLITTLFIGLVCASADDAAPTPPPFPTDALLMVIAQAKAEEFSRALVELKLQEVALQHATPTDENKLALVRAQQSAIDEELVHLVVAPLRAQVDELSKYYGPTHAKVIALKAEIDRCKAILSPRK